jgi:L-lactate dehydrogenase complex protein LldE
LRTVRDGAQARRSPEPGRRRERCASVLSFLTDVLELEDVLLSSPGHLSSDVPFAARAGDRRGPLRSLRAERGVELVELPAARECCGFGGTFAVKNVDVSTAMVADKLGHVLATGVEVCTAVDNSCLMQIGGALSRLDAGVRAMHLAEILAAEGGEPATRASRLTAVERGPT